MSLLVAHAPDEHGGAAVQLAAMLARSAGDDLVVCTVVPAPWSPGLARIDAEFRAFLDQTAQEALARARAAVPGDVRAAYQVEHARSAPAGLLAAAAAHAATPIVLGSSSDGVFGHVAFGSVTSRLLHSSPVALALATRGYRCRPDGRVQRVSVAFAGDTASADLVSAAATAAARMGAALRVVTFVVRPPTMLTAGVGSRAEQALVQEWVRGVETARAQILARIDLPVLRAEVETVIGHGRRWAEAMDDVAWSDGDLLVVGSSGTSPAVQVFLGSRAAKIVRHSPVPVLVVPRG